jgi:hypothetical protein
MFETAAERSPLCSFQPSQSRNTCAFHTELAIKHKAQIRIRDYIQANDVGEPATAFSVICTQRCARRLHAKQMRR